MGGGAAAVKQSGGCQHERAGAHRGHPFGVGGESAHLREQLLVGARQVHVATACHHERLHLSSHFAQRVVLNSMPLEEETIPPVTLTSSVWYAAASTKRVAVENTSRGPVTSRICAELKVTMTTRCPLAEPSIPHRMPALSMMAEIVNPAAWPAGLGAAHTGRTRSRILLPPVASVSDKLTYSGDLEQPKPLATHTVRRLAHHETR